MSVTEPTSPAETVTDPRLDAGGTQVLVRGATTPLTGDDPREINGIRLHERFLGGNASTAKYHGRGPNGYHFVKVLVDESLTADFENERGIAAKLTESKTLPQFTGSGTTWFRGRERLWYAQRLLNGPLLLDQLAPSGLKPDRLVQLAGDLASAILDMSALGLAHGDIKPEHIIDQGRYVLVDLGSGRTANPAEHPTSILNTGTTSYAAPERFHGVAATSSSDVYSWGIVMLYAATGRHPLPHGPSGLAAADLEVTIARLPERLADLVRTTLNPDPAKRPSPSALASAAKALSVPQTAVLSNDTIELPSHQIEVALSKRSEPVIKALASLGDLKVGYYRLTLVAILAVVAWITYAIVVGA